VEEELDAFIQHCKAGMQLVDVGASYGVFSLTAMAWPESRALLIEPHPPSIKILGELQRMNGLSDQRFTVVPAAAGAQDGCLAMEGDEFYLACPASGTSVPMRSLDSLCSELGFRPTHIKIDVEGFEFEVLKGSVTVLEQCMPVLHLEIHNGFLADRGTDPAEIYSFLTARGYDRVWSLVENGAEGAPSVTRTLWCDKREALHAAGIQDGARVYLA
jgi:FkbM family methyltransferase